MRSRPPFLLGPAIAALEYRSRLKGPSAASILMYLTEDERGRRRRYVFDSDDPTIILMDAEWMTKESPSTT
jgi:hypothetical protein